MFWCSLVGADRPPKQAMPAARQEDLGLCVFGRSLCRYSPFHAVKKWHCVFRRPVAVVCPNVTGRTKKRIAQSKRARAGSLALVDWPQVARTCILQAFGLQMPWRFFSGVTFVLFCFVFRLYAFVEAAALRSIVLRYAGVPIATRVSFFYFFPLFFGGLFGDVALSECFFRFLFVWRVRRTFSPSGWCFFYLVTTTSIFDISLCENSIKKSIKRKG